MQKGWISLHRSIQDNELWLSEPFTKAQAWVDLLMLANHTPQTIFKRGIAIKLNRGEVGWSEVALSDRWRWSREKVRNFLNHLKTVQQIDRQINKTLSRIIIINYDKYQLNQTTDQTTDQTNDNNVNNINNLKGDMFKTKYNEDGHYDEAAIDAETGEPLTSKGPVKNKTRAVDADVLAVFELFNNPAKVLWRMRELERVAAKALFDTYGLETLKKRVARIELERQKKDPYFPDAHTPSELLEKMPRIERFLGI